MTTCLRNSCRLLVLLCGITALIAAPALAQQKTSSQTRPCRQQPCVTRTGQTIVDAKLPDDAAVEELRERPRPVGPGEAARILGVAPEALASLNLPVTPAPDGGVVYDSWEIVHWVDVRRTDPAGFEARTARR